MGDRIVIQITDGKDVTPDFYGHWCGLRGLKVLQDLVRDGGDYDINSLICNLIVSVMNGRPKKYSYYLYNHGEADGIADWDNFTWTFDTSTKRWTTSHPDFKGRTVSMDEVDDFVKEHRPELYREGDE